jgi:hypothetical protein
MKDRYVADSNRLLIEFRDAPAAETRDLDDRSKRAIGWM